MTDDVDNPLLRGPFCQGTDSQSFDSHDDSLSVTLCLMFLSDWGSSIEKKGDGK